MLISLHLPKTAGSSFLASLEDYYGSNLLCDYADLPIHEPVLKRSRNALKMCIINRVKFDKNVQCIHGHFLPLKYLLLRNAKFVTWMRDPVEMLASHYFYWLRSYNPHNAPPCTERLLKKNGL